MTRNDALLCSINDRLGSVCKRFGAAEAGADLEPLGDEWLLDLRQAACRQEAPVLSEGFGDW